jgi:hypothetical protein
VEDLIESAVGCAVFPSVGKGGLMVEASVWGQDFGYRPL